MILQPLSIFSAALTVLATSDMPQISRRESVSTTMALQRNIRRFADQ